MKENKQLEVVKSSELDAKETQKPEKKEVDYSQAIKEKNQKIQELKARIRQLEEENKNLQSLGFGSTEESANTKKEIDEVLNTLRAMKKQGSFSSTYVTALDETLKHSYKEGVLYFYNELAKDPELMLAYSKAVVSIKAKKKEG